MLKKIIASVAFLAVLAAEAQAALPASVGTTVSAIETDGTALFNLVFPVVAAFVGLAVVIKLFKRFANKM